LLGVRPHWPPREDQDRLLFLVIPAVLAVEVVGALAGRLQPLAWLLRLVVAAAAARVLLHNTSYLTDLSGPGTREWTTTQALLILGGLAVILAGVWGALTWLGRRSGGRSVPLALAVASAGAAVAVMLSGYASGGQLGLPLAAGLVGATLASLLVRGRLQTDGLVGLGVVGLFALLLIGHFFGQLSATYAAVLFLGPLLCGLPELPYVRRLAPVLRGAAGILLTTVPVVLVLVLAQQKFVADSAQSTPDSKEPSLQDYMDYGK
jgi:hypothetical protein